MKPIHGPTRSSAGDNNFWKRYLFDGMLAIAGILVMFVFALQIHPHPDIAIILFFYLFIVLWLAYKRGFGTAILAAFMACTLFDFFFVQPIFSFRVSKVEEGLELLTFLTFAIILSYAFSRVQNRAEKAKRQNHEASLLYEERLRKQTEEVSRRDNEMSVFYNVVQATKDEKDLKQQLSIIAQAMEDTYASCGVRSCVLLLPNGDGKPSLQTHQTGICRKIELSSDEDAIIIWVIKEGKSVTLPNIPLISRAKGSYLRRTVASSTGGDMRAYGYSYIAPLMSEHKVIGVLRLLIDDDANPRLIAIKNILEMKQAVSSRQSELFAKLLDYAVSLIKQALIEQALMQQEFLRNELRRRTEELHAAIISSVSHDFHTPLTLIKGAASSLLDPKLPWEEEAERRHTLEAIVSEANWLERILTRMLDLSRIEKGTLTPEKERYPIEEIILNTLDLGHMRSLIQGRCIEKDVPDDLPSVEVDPILIGQVLMNLIENAIRYTPAESPIEISVQADSDRMLITVADQGPGIPLLETERIFEKFYSVKRMPLIIEGNTLSTADSALLKQGSGLGLAVCRGFVEAHGGRIWAKNRKSGGAKFQFTLPLEEKR